MDATRWRKEGRNFGTRADLLINDVYFAFILLYWWHRHLSGVIDRPLATIPDTGSHLCDGEARQQPGLPFIFRLAYAPRYLSLDLCLIIWPSSHPDPNCPPLFTPRPTLLRHLPGSVLPLSTVREKGCPRRPRPINRRLLPLTDNLGRVTRLFIVHDRFPRRAATCSATALPASTVHLPR